MSTQITTATTSIANATEVSQASFESLTHSLNQLSVQLSQIMAQQSSHTDLLSGTDFIKIIASGKADPVSFAAFFSPPSLFLLGVLAVATAIFGYVFTMIVKVNQEYRDISKGFAGHVTELNNGIGAQLTNLTTISQRVDEAYAKKEELSDFQRIYTNLVTDIFVWMPDDTFNTLLNPWDHKDNESIFDLIEQLADRIEPNKDHRGLWPRKALTIWGYNQFLNWYKIGFPADGEEYMELKRRIHVINELYPTFIHTIGLQSLQYSFLNEYYHKKNLKTEAREAGRLCIHYCKIMINIDPDSIPPFNNIAMILTYGYGDGGIDEAKEAYMYARKAYQNAKKRRLKQANYKTQNSLDSVIETQLYLAKTYELEKPPGWQALSDRYKRAAEKTRKIYQKVKAKENDQHR